MTNEWIFFTVCFLLSSHILGMYQRWPFQRFVGKTGVITSYSSLDVGSCDFSWSLTEGNRMKARLVNEARIQKFQCRICSRLFLNVFSEFNSDFFHSSFEGRIWWSCRGKKVNILIFNIDDPAVSFLFLHSVLVKDDIFCGPIWLYQGKD